MARHFVGPDLGPNSLQKLSADDISDSAIGSDGTCIFHTVLHLTFPKTMSQLNIIW